MKDVAFFVLCKRSNRLQLLPSDASDEEILSADAATLKIENQKNGWKDVCIHQQWNGDATLLEIIEASTRMLEASPDVFVPDVELDVVLLVGRQLGVVIALAMRADVHKSAPNCSYTTLIIVSIPMNAHISPT